MAESIPFSSKNVPIRDSSILLHQPHFRTIQNRGKKPLSRRNVGRVHGGLRHVELGTLDVSVLSTKVGKEGRPKQVYTIAPSGVHKMAGLDIVGCHIMAHPHGLFYCHSIATLFFLEKDLHPNAKMTLQFPSTSFKAAFLPRRVAESIPFSSKNLSEILRYFSINPTSVQSKTVAKNLQMCEAPPTPKERKLCATSVESMVDFATSNLGTLDVSVMSTNVGKEGRPKQVYTIAPSGVHKMAGLDIVGCHIMTHPHGLFYCHSTREARAYTIEMVGEDGALVVAAAVCHVDTLDWNPNYVGLQLLKVSPGTPVCHFLSPDHVLWAHNN